MIEGMSSGELEARIAAALSQAEIDAFAETISTAEYAGHERDYKVAVHEVLSRLFAADRFASPGFVDQLTAFFEGRLDLASLGFDDASVERVEAAVSEFRGVRYAFINLAGGRFAVNNFIWIPAAVGVGLGEELRVACRQLFDGSLGLAGRVDAFRESLYAIEEESQRRGGFEPQWNLVRISLGFIGQSISPVSSSPEEIATG